MKGWLFTKTGVPTKLIEKEDPVPKADEVIVKIKASGLCHSDVGALHDEGWMALITAAPVIFGHEGAGEIIEVGANVTDFKVGDRVGIAPINPDVPGDAVGYTRDGVYATHCAVPANQLVPLPDEVSYEYGAMATDAGMTSYHALFARGQAKAGMKVGIIGIGGLGQIAAKMALIEGCTVYAADVSPEARALAKEMGCHGVFEDVREMADLGPELIVDYAGFGTTTSGAVEVVAHGGTVVVVGMGRLETTINTTLLITKAVSLLGSVGGTGEDIKGVYKFMATGELQPTISTIEFERIDEGLKMLERGEVQGRLVAIVNPDN